MPPLIARSLLAGTPPDALARSFDSATIAFILLEEYGDKVAWSAFTGDCFGKTVFVMRPLLSTGFC